MLGAYTTSPAQEGDVPGTPTLPYSPNVCWIVLLRVNSVCPPDPLVVHPRAVACSSRHGRHCRGAGAYACVVSRCIPLRHGAQCRAHISSRRRKPTTSAASALSAPWRERRADAISIRRTLSTSAAVVAVGSSFSLSSSSSS